MASHRVDDTAPSDLHEEIIIKESEDTDTDCNFIEEEIYSASPGSLNVFSTVSCVGNDDETLEESASSPGRQLPNVPLSEDFHTEFYNKNSSIHEVLTTENEKLVLLGIEIEENDCAAILSQEPNTTGMAAANDTESKSTSNNVKTKRKKRSRKPMKKKTNNRVLKSSKKSVPLPSKKSRSKQNTNTITVDRVRDMLKAQDEIESDAEKEPGDSKLGSRILLKVQECEFPFNRNIYLDFIRMGFKDMNFQYLMIYKDTFTDYILLRPLVFDFSVKEISLELFKIFADFGIPNIVEVNAFYVSDVSNAIKTIQKSFNIGEIIVKSKMLRDGQISEEGKDVRKRLLKWTKIEENNHWAIGCYVIQQCLNKRITASDSFSPYIKVFAKNKVRAKCQKATNLSEPCQNINENQIADTEKKAYIVTRNQSKLKSNSSKKKFKPKVVTNTRKKHQNENTNVIKPVTDSSRFKTKFDNHSTNTIIKKNVRSYSNSNLNNLLLETTRDNRKRRTKIIKSNGIKIKRTSSPAKTKIRPQPSMSFESYSGLDKILNVSNVPDTESSSSLSLIDVEKKKKCEKCGKETTDGVRCLNCKTET